MDWIPACHEFDSSIAEDPPCKRGRCTFILFGSTSSRCLSKLVWLKITQTAHSETPSFKGLCNFRLLVLKVCLTPQPLSNVIKEDAEGNADE
ncbi:hypothetical protein TNCV_787831 [Trichonephila clavipes]|nr:hypothetical protein TNCV_787831 [Trichonephila clavipes]